MSHLRTIANCSLSTGHVDPVRLVPAFSRVGVLPPHVKMVGDLVPVEDRYKEQISEALGVAADEDVCLFWMEPAAILYVDLFEKTKQITIRDFRAAYVDQISKDLHEVLHIGNTEYFDFLPQFCRDFLGVPIEIGFLYAVDRSGFSVFGLRDGTDDAWREYRFPFQTEVMGKQGFLDMVEAMKAELNAAEAQSPAK